MLKIFGAYLTVFTLCIQQVLAGNSFFHPVKENQEEKVRATLSSSVSSNKDYEQQTVIDKPKVKLSTTDSPTSESTTYSTPPLNSPEKKAKTSSSRYQSCYSNEYNYTNENFNVESWKKEMGLPNKVDKKLAPRSSIKSTRVKLSFSASTNMPSLLGSNNYGDDDSLSRLNHITVYHKNPRKYLQDRIFRLQQSYHMSESSDQKIYFTINDDCTLQNNFENWLQEDYIQRRIEGFKLVEEGKYLVILRKDKNPK
jgi:hypothetical protein